MEQRTHTILSAAAACAVVASFAVSGCASPPRPAEVARAPAAAPADVAQAPAAQPAQPAAARPVQPWTADIEIRAEAMLNVDPRGRPAPLVIRVYELRAPVKFQAADFFALFERDQAALGEDMIKREEFQLRPGETRTLSREFSPDTRSLGVFAAYRDLERATWRALLPIPEPSARAGSARVSVNIGLGTREVRVTGR